MSLIGFLITILLLVTVHEWGHFIVARLCGVKVLRFSVGFGKPIWSKVGASGTEYAIAPIPLGGYVRMLDERQEAVPESEKHLSFNAQPLWQRAAIVAAGPVINLLLAILLFFVVYVSGYQYQPALIGKIIDDSPAATAQLVEGTEIHEVNGAQVMGWGEVFRALSLESGKGQTEVTLGLMDDEFSPVSHYQLMATDLLVDPKENPIKALGILPTQALLPAVLGEVMSSGAAYQAGLQSGDEIISIDGLTIESWETFVKQVMQSPNKTLQVGYMRNGSYLTTDITPKAVELNGETIGRVGVQANIALAEQNFQPKTLALGVLPSVSKSVSETWSLIKLQVVMLGKLITGQLSSDHLGGPISIAKAAGQNVDAGFQPFLVFLASFSIMLGVLNLLPIPVLDGGHLLLMAIEAIRGKPLSEFWQQKLMTFGVAALLSIMLFAILKDFSSL